MPRRDGHCRARGGLASGVARTPRSAHHPNAMRYPDWHRDRRSAGRQHRVGVHDELHVMGDTVNLASRLEAANKVYGSHCLVSEATVAAAVGAAIEVREIDRVVVLGQSQPQVIFDIIGRRGELASNAMLLRTRYAEGLTAYRAGCWDEARAAFNAGLAAVPDDDD